MGLVQVEGDEVSLLDSALYLEHLRPENTSCSLQVNQLSKLLAGKAERLNHKRGQVFVYSLELVELLIILLKVTHL